MSGDSETGGGWVESLSLSLVGGLLLAAPFLEPGLFWIHYAALVPWAVMLDRARPRVWAPTFLAGAFAYFALAFAPFALLHPVIPPFAGVVIGVTVLPFAVAVRALRRGLGLALWLVVPLAWVASEWLRLRFSVGETALFPLGAAQYRLTPLIQIADLAGLAGVSFVVAAASGALAEAWLRRRQGWRRATAPLVIFAVLLAAVLAYGAWRLSALGPFRPGPRIALVQPHEVHYRDPRRARELFDKQDRFTRAEIEPGEADLLAWPENAIDYPFTEDFYFLAGLDRLARDYGAAVVAGAFSWASKREGTLYTSAYYLPPGGGELRRYDKIYLIPWAERLPLAWLERLSPRLDRWHRAVTRRVLGYDAPGVPGVGVILFPVTSGGRTHRFAVPICYEVAHRGFAPRAVAAGADFLLNISSEGYFGPPLYVHMWALSTLRAVESRLAVVRVGNHGLSGFIDPAGRTHGLVRGRESGRPYLEAGTLVGRPRLATPGTFYSRHGDWLSHLAAGLSALGLVAAFVRRRSSAASARETSSRPKPKR